MTALAPTNLDELDRAIDRLVDHWDEEKPPVLYHYTSLDAFEKIIGKQLIRATLHTSTDDEEELQSADALIANLAEVLLGKQGAEVNVRGAIGQFMRDYWSRRAHEAFDYYLFCLTPYGDDRQMWGKYGASKLSMGFKVIQGEEPPEIEYLSTGLIHVEYDEAALKRDVRHDFHRVTKLVRDYIAVHREDESQACGYLKSALFRIAGWASIRFKREMYRFENEWRLGGMDGRDSHGRARVCQVEWDGKGRTRFGVFIPLRRPPLRMALDRVVLGPANDTATIAKVEDTLRAAGYDDDMPRVVVSTQQS